MCRSKIRFLIFKKLNKSTIFIFICIIIYAIAIMAVAFLLPSMISALLCLILVVYCSVQFGLAGGIASSVWSAGVMTISYFSQHSNFLYLIVGSLSYFAIAIGVGKVITIINQQKLQSLKTTQQYQTLIDNMPKAVAVYEAINDGKDFIFKDFNPAAERIDGIVKKELIGKKITEVFPGVEDFGLLEILKKVWKTGKPEFQQASFYKDYNREGWRENYVYKLPSGEVVAIYDNVAEQIKMNEKLYKINRSLNILSRANEIIIKAEDEKVMLQEICNLIVEEGKYLMAWIGFAEKIPDNIVVPAAFAGFEEDYLKSITVTWDDSETGIGPAGTAIRTGQPFVCRDIMNDSTFAPWRKEAVKRGYASVIALPLINEKIVFGSLNIYASEPGAFTSEEIELLVRLANNISFGVEFIRNESKLKISEQKYKTLFQQSTDALILVDDQYYIKDCNPYSCSMLGYEREEMLSMNFKDFINIEDLAKQPLKISDASMDKPFTLIRKLSVKNGKNLIVGENISKINNNHYLISLRNITENMIAQEKVHTQAEQFKTLFNLSSKLNATLNISKVFKICCEETMNLLKVSAVAILLYDSKQEIFNWSYSVGLPEEFIKNVKPIPYSLYKDLVQKEDFECVIPAISNYPQLPDKELFSKFNIQSCIFSNIERNKSLIGILVAATIGKSHTFLEDDLNLIKNIADQASQAISNAKLIEDIKRRLEHIQALRNIDMAITGSLDLRVTLNVALDEVQKQLGVDAAAILRIDPRTTALRYEAWRGFNNVNPGNLELEIGGKNLLLNSVIINRETIQISNLHNVEDEIRKINLFDEEGFVSYCATPLFVKGHVQGVLEIFNRKSVFPFNDWVEFLKTLANQIAIAIDNSELFYNLDRTNLKLVQSYDKTIEGWAYALDLKDKETEGHSRRVTEITLMIAKKMGINNEELSHIKRGALLHDIGKMGIPDSILLKEGKLTDEEWTIMHKHPIYAYNMLSPISYLQQALNIPYCHHEKWDGTGYPRGLKGEEIPLAARIFAVADVHDALTNDRPYRQAWSKKDALIYIKEQSNKHFDPEVVKIFLNVYGKLKIL